MDRPQKNSMNEKLDEISKSDKIEIFEGRFQASVDDIIKVTDNFIRKRDYDGIHFLDFVICWEDKRRMYYGRRRDESTQIQFTITLGYIEITKLRRLSEVGVRVRIVCVWPPLLKYWEEIPKILEDMFEVIKTEVRIKEEHGEKRIDLTRGKPGRKPDPLYDQTFQRIQDGEDYLDVFKWWCQEGGIEKPTSYDRKRFKTAMKRRQNKS
jgi:hypothetical protein